MRKFWGATEEGDKREVELSGQWPAKKTLKVAVGIVWKDEGNNNAPQAVSHKYNRVIN